MKLLIIIFSTFIINTAWANGKTSNGIDYPQYLSVVSGKEHADISGKCNEVDDTSGDITCTFDERMIFHKNLALAKKNIADLKNKNNPEFKNLLDAIKEGCSARFSKDDLKSKSLQGFRRLCNDPHDFSRASLIKDAQDSLKKDRSTCEIEAKTFTQRFHYNDFSHQWVYQDIPDGACGVIEITHIERASEHSWKYTSRMIITNKSGIDPRGNCSNLTKKEQDSVYYDYYDLDGNDLTQLMNCKFIGFDTNYKWD